MSWISNQGTGWFVGWYSEVLFLLMGDQESGNGQEVVGLATQKLIHVHGCKEMKERRKSTS